MLLQNPLEGCFFCEPEPWRTIYVGKRVQILAGTGPLCPGYCLIAPRDHIHSTAELPERMLFEFLTVAELLQRSFVSHYGVGFTAYEHGRIGACRMLEHVQDLSTFCHHAHRILIPRSTNCEAEISRWFEEQIILQNRESIASLNQKDYVYYETGDLSGARRFAFINHKGIPSQFMRRIIASDLGLNRDWNWAIDLNTEEMIDTTSRLRGEFLGIGTVPETITRRERLVRNISIDGLSYVGKSTIAHFLGVIFERPVIDSGLLFRYFAIHGVDAQINENEVLGFLTSRSNDPELRSHEITARTVEIAADPEVRKIYNSMLSKIIKTTEPCIVVGRDTWRFTSGSDFRLLIVADSETRIRRRALWGAEHELKCQDLKEIERHMNMTDSKDAARLPSLVNDGCIMIRNDHRPIEVALDEIVFKYTLGEACEH